DAQRFAPGRGLQRDGAEPPSHHAGAFGRAQVVPVTRARMIGMGMRDQRPLDWPPWVDEKPADLTPEAFGAGNDQLGQLRRSSSRSATSGLWSDNRDHSSPFNTSVARTRKPRW